MNEEEAQYEQQQSYGYAPQPQQMSNVSTDFLIYRLSAEDVLEELEHRLRGERLGINKNGEKFWEQKSMPWMNEDGIQSVLHFCYMSVNKTIFLGNIALEDIKQRCHSLWLILSKFILLNLDRFEVRSDMKSLICATSIYTVHSALSRSEAGKEATQISTQAQRMEHVNLSNQQKPNPLNPLGFIFGKK